MKRIITIIAGLIVLNAQLSSLNAQTDTRPKIACPNNIWVNSYNGVLFYQRADISIPNRSMPLEAVFYYNSSSNKTNYGYGNGWSLGYEYRYVIDTLGIVIESGNGHKDLYVTHGSSFQSPAGVFSTLTAMSSGGYRLTTKEGTIYTFADTLNKQVTQITDRNHNSIHFTYSGGNLTSLSDGNGRQINLQWSGNQLTTIGTNLDNRQWRYVYDTVGNLITVTNPMNASVHYAYDQHNRISRFTDEAGYGTLVTYNDDGMAHRVSVLANARTNQMLADKSIRYEQSANQTVIIDYVDEGHNQFTTYRWDTLGRVIEKVGNCCGYTSKLAYDQDNNVIRSEDANGNVSTYTYDNNGNMLSLTDPLGNSEYYTYTTDGFNNISTYTDKLGHQYTFAYDTNGNLTAINAPLGRTESFTYDYYGLLLTVTDALGNTTTNTYDQYGNLTSTTDALGHTTAIQHNNLGSTISTTSPTGATQRFTYDRMQRVSATINPLNQRATFSYDNRGNIVNYSDPLHRNTILQYDGLNRVIQITDPLQAKTRYTYNAKSKPTQAEDAIHNTAHLYYNDLDLVILSIDAMGDSTHFSYDAAGNPIEVITPNGLQIAYTYDVMNRLVQMSDQYGLIESYLYDANGNNIAIINGSGDTTRMIYDALDRLVQTIAPLGNSEHYTYDLKDNLISHTDANGNTTTYSYDAVGNLLSETNALNYITSYTYTPDGKPASVTDANSNTTSYTYDAAGQLTAITFANGKSQQFWYDAAGNIIRQKDESGNIIQMVYDAHKNLLTRRYPDGSVDSYTYDLLNNMLSATNANATVTFSYDANGKVLSETMNGQTTTYNYNTHSGSIGITYPNGRQVSEQYDSRGRMSHILSMGDTIAKFSYSINNQLTSRTYSNGDVTQFSYNSNNQLTSIQAANITTPIVSLNYQYDPAGNILSKINAIRPQYSETYAYDPINRLASFRHGVADNTRAIPNPLKQIQYTLDALGNRTTTTTNGSTTAYTHNNMNAYTTVGGSAMQYDNNGNLTSDGNRTYQYNYRNLMVSVDNGNTATYRYDALDRRISKTTQAGTVQYFYRGIQTIEERFGTDTTTYIFGDGIDDILQMERGGNAYYYHKNHLGSVVAITNAMGAIVESYEYDPYGTPIIFNHNGDMIAHSSINNTILFTGREYDYESGLYNYRSRTYHHFHGRFMQHDPLLYVDNYDLYQYAGNEPINIIDPMGTSIFQLTINYASRVFSRVPRVSKILKFGALRTQDQERKMTGSWGHMSNVLGKWNYLASFMAVLLPSQNPSDAEESDNCNSNNINNKYPENKPTYNDYYEDPAPLWEQILESLLFTVALPAGE